MPRSCHARPGARLLGVALVLAAGATGCAEDKPTGPVGRFASVGAIIEDGSFMGIVGGARSTASRGPLAESWRLDLDRWTFSPGPAPPFATCRGIATATEDGGLQVFGGSTTGWSEHAAHWAWDAAGTDRWSTLAGPAPAPRFKHAAARDPETGRVFLTGGRTNDSGDEVYFGDLWRWTPAEGWTELPTTGGPHGLHRHVMVWDAARALLWVHGGYQPPREDPEGEPVRSDRLWRLDPETGVWTEEAWTEGPPIRASHALALHDGALIVWGGNASDESTWSYDPDAAAWTEHAPAVGPQARDAMAVAVADGGETLVLVGGDPVSDAVPDFVMDVWTLDLATLAWTERVGIGAD